MRWQTTPMSKRVDLFAIPIFQPVSFFANARPNSFGQVNFRIVLRNSTSLFFFTHLPCCSHFPKFCH